MKKEYNVYFKFDEDKEIKFASIDNKFGLIINKGDGNDIPYIEFITGNKKFKLIVASDYQLKNELRYQKLKKILDK